MKIQILYLGKTAANAKSLKMVSLPATMTDALFIYQQDSVPKNQQHKETSAASVSSPRKTSVVHREKSAYINPVTANQLVASQEQAAPQLVLPAYKNTVVNTDWLTLIIFATAAVFATIRYSYVNYITHLFTSLVNYPTAVRLLQESNYPASHAAYRLDVIFYVGFSIFVSQAMTISGLAGSSIPFLFFLKVAAGVLLYFLIKRLLYRVVGTLFETREETGEYLFNMSNFNRTLGIVLIPLVALVSFAPIENPGILVFSGIAIVLAFNLVLLKRGMLILLKKQFSILYLFLYLCTLEFLPLLLIYKVVVVE